MSVRLNWTMSLPSSTSRSATRLRTHHTHQRDQNPTLHSTWDPHLQRPDQRWSMDLPSQHHSDRSTGGNSEFGGCRSDALLRLAARRPNLFAFSRCAIGPRMRSTHRRRKAPETAPRGRRIPSQLDPAGSGCHRAGSRTAKRSWIFRPHTADSGRPGRRRIRAAAARSE